MLPFFQTSVKDVKDVKDDSNRYFKPFAIDLPHSYIMQMEILSHPYALFVSILFIIRSISLFFISKLLIFSWVLQEKLGSKITRIYHRRTFKGKSY